MPLIPPRRAGRDFGAVTSSAFFALGMPASARRFRASRERTCSRCPGAPRCASLSQFSSRSKGLSWTFAGVWLPAPAGPRPERASSILRCSRHLLAIFLQKSPTSSQPARETTSERGRCRTFCALLPTFIVVHPVIGVDRMPEREQATEILDLAVGLTLEAFLEPVPLRLDDTKFDVARVRVALLQSLLDVRRLARAVGARGRTFFCAPVRKIWAAIGPGSAACSCRRRTRPRTRRRNPSLATPLCLARADLSPLSLGSAPIVRTVLSACACPRTLASS